MPLVFVCEPGMFVNVDCSLEHLVRSHQSTEGLGKCMSTLGGTGQKKCQVGEEV